MPTASNLQRVRCIAKYHVFLCHLQRMSMADIKQHPWFQHHLPEGALAMNDWYLTKQPNAEQVCSSHLSGCILEQ